MRLQQAGFRPRVGFHAIVLQVGEGVRHITCHLPVSVYHVPLSRITYPYHVSHTPIPVSHTCVTYHIPLYPYHIPMSRITYPDTRITYPCHIPVYHIPHTDTPGTPYLYHAPVYHTPGTPYLYHVPVYHTPGTPYLYHVLRTTHQVLHICITCLHRAFIGLPLAWVGGWVPVPARECVEFYYWCQQPGGQAGSS